jgi:hypothetical protein
VSQLVLAERECRDLGRWARMRECFHSGSEVRIRWFHGSGPEFVQRSIEVARRSTRATRRLEPVAVRLNGGRTVASPGAIIDIPGRLDGVEIFPSRHARFPFRAGRRDGRWALAGFEAFALRDGLHPQLRGQAVPVMPEQVACCATPRRVSGAIRTEAPAPARRRRQPARPSDSIGDEAPANLDRQTPVSRTVRMVCAVPGADPARSDRRQPRCSNACACSGCWRCSAPRWRCSTFRCSRSGTVT